MAEEGTVKAAKLEARGGKGGEGWKDKYMATISHCLAHVHDRTTMVCMIGTQCILSNIHKVLDACEGTFPYNS